MINKIYKRIHNKHLVLFKFFFFLRHIFTIFLIAITLFFTIPKFFNYEKKQQIIEDYLINYYDLELDNYKSIEFKIFPLPNLYIKNIYLKVREKPIIFRSRNMNIFLNFKNIYNYQNFNAKKILFNGSKISLDINRSDDLIDYFKQLKNNIDIKSLNIDLKKNDNSLIEIKNVNFSNYGYKKYHFNGKIFDKKFKASLKEKNQNLNFKILNTGISAKLLFDENKLKKNITGSSKINLSNNLIKFNFDYNNKNLKILKSNFRNKDLSFSLDSFIKFNPFFNISSNININEINNDFIGKLNLDDILKKKKIIKKINSEIKINYKSKKFFSSFIESYSSNLNIAYGRLDFTNKILFAGAEINCRGDSILIDQYPRLNFVCLFILKDKKILSKKLSIPNLNFNTLNINIDGSVNLISKKINFNKINIEDKYLANKEDMKYFKDIFEKNLLDDGFFQIFNKSKINKLLLEII
jgi:hypothetical protein